MAGWVFSGALLLVMLAGASYSFPSKTKGYDAGSSYGGGYGAGSASGGGYGTDTASIGSAAPSSTVVGSGAAPAAVANPVPPQPTVHAVPLAAPHGSNALAAPASFSAQDIAWVVPPPRFFEETSTRAGAQPLASSNLGPSHVSPPSPEFQAGELAQMETNYEYGNAERETAQQDFQALPHGAPFAPEQAPTVTIARHPVGRWPVYPYFDYMFLTGQYPPGTFTRYDEDFEEGETSWYDKHYRYYPIVMAPADSGVTQPKKPVKTVRRTTGKQRNPKGVRTVG